MKQPDVAARMGFDPRRWRSPPGPRPVTANIDGLIAENQALRWQVQQLREEILRLRRAAERSEAWRYGGGGGQGADSAAAAKSAAESSPSPGAAPRQRGGGAAGAAAGSGSRGQAGQRVTRGAAPSVTAVQVERWVEAMARHPAWGELRIGPPGGLRALIDQLRAQAWNPALSLEEELDRRQIGLGRELSAALRGPHSRGRWAVRAAFALYGPSAIEWLSDEPLRVVSELQRRLARQAPPGPFPGGDPGRRRGTRTANHSEAGADPRGSGGRKDAGRSTASAGPPPDPRRAALSVLGLEAGASTQQIKRAYRQLAKAHHPDLGGDPEAFRRLDAAYRMLIEC